MPQGVERGTLLAGVGAGAGGVPGVRAVDGGAIHVSSMEGRDWCSRHWDLGTGITRGTAGSGRDWLRLLIVWRRWQDGVGDSEIGGDMVTIRPGGLLEARAFPSTN